jgi:hypothetical protein
MSETLHKAAPAATTREAEPPILDQILDQVVALTQAQARPSPVNLRSWEEIERFAEKAARSGMVPPAYKGVPDAITIAVMMGMEIGLAPMQALQNISVINGRPSLWGDAMPALVRASGKARSIREWSEGDGETLVCHCEAIRRDDPHPIRASFGVTDAKKAGLWGKSGPWQQYPRRMLQARARGFCLRDAFADVLKGLISTEEARDIPYAPQAVAEPASPVVVTPEAPPPPPRLSAEEWLNRLELELANALTGEAVDAILARRDVQAAQDRARNSHRDRLDGMINDAIARTTAAETTAPDDDGLFAPGQDPFAEQAP